MTVFQTVNSKVQNLVTKCTSFNFQDFKATIFKSAAKMFGRSLLMNSCVNLDINYKNMYFSIVEIVSTKE